MTVSPFLNFTQNLAWSGVEPRTTHVDAAVFQATAPPAGFEPATLS
jgi:hypothetical protein